jgi:hypothetical protein
MDAETVWRRLSPQQTHKAPSYPILRRLSRPRITALHLAARRCGGQPRAAGAAVIAPGKG